MRRTRGHGRSGLPRAFQRLSSRGRALTLGALIFGVLALALFGHYTGTGRPGTVTIRVITESAVATWRLQQSVGWQPLEPNNDAAQARLRTYAPGSIRFMIGGDKGGDPVDAGGHWDFRKLDQLVTQMKDASAGRASPMLSYWKPTNFNGCDRSDAGFSRWGDVLASMVKYYNSGWLNVGEQRLTNPAGTANRIDYWEIWNEPDLEGDDCALTVSQYVEMFNIVAPMMKAIDPTVKLAGPALAETLDGRWLQPLMQGPNKPDIISWHAYGGSNRDTDAALFDAIDNQIVINVQQCKRYAMGIPIWVTEANSDYSWTDDPAGRPWGSLGTAWNAELFRRLGLDGVTAINAYNWKESKQFALIYPPSKATPLLPYWRATLLQRYFPVGSTVLQTTTSMAKGVEALAVRKPNGRISVLIINRRTTGGTDGKGVPTKVTVRIEGSPVRAVTNQELDAAIDPANEPGMIDLPASAPKLSLPGFGVALLDVET